MVLWFCIKCDGQCICYHSSTNGIYKSVFCCCRSYKCILVTEFHHILWNKIQVCIKEWNKMENNKTMNTLQARSGRDINLKFCSRVRNIIRQSTEISDVLQRVFGVVINKEGQLWVLHRSFLSSSYSLIICKLEIREKEIDMWYDFHSQF